MACHIGMTTSWNILPGDSKGEKEHRLGLASWLVFLQVHPGLAVLCEMGVRQGTKWPYMVWLKGCRPFVLGSHWVGGRSRL
jgi:hypothetical protein